MAGHDRGLIKKTQAAAFQNWLSNNGFAWRAPQGEYQLMQVKIPDGWGAICFNNKGVVSTPTEIREHLKCFNQGKDWPSNVLRMAAQQARKMEAIDSDLRDDFAIAALQGLLAGRPDDVSSATMTAELWAKAAYKMADAMLAERTK